MVRLPINMHFDTFFLSFFFWLECPLSAILTPVCLTIGKPALQSKPKKRLTRKKENIHSPPIATQCNSFYLSPGEYVLKVLCHWNHIGELKTTLCGTPDALTVYYYPVLTLPPTQSSSSHDLVAYSLTSSFNFHLSGNLEHFCSLRHIVVDIHYKNLMLMPSKYADVRVIFRGLWASCSSSSSHWLYIIHTSYTAARFRTSKILLVPPSCALYSSTVTVLSLSMPHTGRLYLLSDSDETFKSITFCTTSFSWPRLKAAFHD